MTLVLQYVARSDRGLVRSNNQDAVYAGPRLLAVADGMGGHAAGEVASKVVIAALAPLDDDEPGEDLLGQLHEAVLTGNGAISELVANDPDMEGMGTTLTAVLFSGSRLGLVHVGDSRAYLWRGGQLSQITHDDSFVQSLVDEGRITQEEANNHPQRSLLLRALTGHDIEPSLTVREARAGDRYLLCSDGLSSVISHETLTEAVQIPDQHQCADRMIELALKGGGPDNVTVIIADVVDVDFGEDAPIVGGSAGDGSDDHQPPDSPASRAQAITAPKAAPQEIPAAQPEPPDPKVKRRKRFRLFAIIAAVLVVLAGVLFGTWYWVQQQYFVGLDGNNEVSIFEGVRGSVLGMSLNHKVQGSCAPGDPRCETRHLSDFTPAAQAQLTQGITADSLSDAQDKITTLESGPMMLAPCPSPSASSSSRPTASGSSASSRAGAATTTTQPAKTTKAAPTTTGRPTQSPTTSLTPGVNCREGN